MGKTPWECLITVSMKKSASTVLWTRFKILMLRVFMCRFSPKRYLWCSAPVLSIGPIIIPLTLFMIFDCDMVGGCGWYETLSYGSIWTLVLLNCPCWWWWRHRCCCCRLIGTPPPIFLVLFQSWMQKQGEVRFLVADDVPVSEGGQHSPGHMR